MTYTLTVGQTVHQISKDLALELGYRVVFSNDTELRNSADTSGDTHPAFLAACAEGLRDDAAALRAIAIKTQRRHEVRLVTEQKAIAEINYKAAEQNRIAESIRKSMSE